MGDARGTGVFQHAIAVYAIIVHFAIGIAIGVTIAIGLYLGFCDTFSRSDLDCDPDSDRVWLQQWQALDNL